MPGMHMCGAVVRPGCVLMTLDVIREEPDAEAAVAAEAAAANMLGEVAGAIRTSGGQMRDGAVVYCQVCVCVCACQHKARHVATIVYIA